MDELLYVCNRCDEMHADETDYCQSCQYDSLRSVPEIELLEGMQWDEEPSK